MSMRIQAVNGRCPCRRCQDAAGPSLADFGIIGPGARIPVERLSRSWLRSLMAILKGGQR